MKTCGLFAANTMSDFFQTLQISPEGDSAIRVALGDTISPEAALAVRVFAAAVDAARLTGVVECVPAYCTVMVLYDPLRVSAHTLCQQLLKVSAQPFEGGIRGKTNPSISVEKSLATATAFRSAIEIPVCYGEEFGPDLDDVAAHCSLAGSDVVRLHSEAQYTVACVGFVPGFAYLLGLSDDIAVPRLPQPRIRVPAGSVAIGGAQTGIYPLETPGGWRLIGRTPLQLFGAALERPALLAVGDRVRFLPISRDEFVSFREGAER